MRARDGKWRGKQAGLTVAGCMVVVCLVGCSGSPYERIEPWQKTDAALEETAEAAEIVIETEAPTEAELPAEDYTILFGGDVMLSDYVLQ
ncbi:MAG: hypothetical protein LUC94_11310, partial [Clostridiales bacterium]|nr:hypothetical protein [Clostridiales bacterium]